MKALIKTKKGYGNVELMDIQEPECKDDEIKIKIKAVGICGTDLHILEGSFPNYNPPVILARIDALEIELALACGEIEMVKNKAFDISLRPGRDLNALYENKWQALAKLFVATGHTGQAVDILNDLILIAWEQNRMHSVIHLKTCLSRELQKIDQADEAVRVLISALNIAEPQNYLRIFIDAGPEIKPLLKIIAAEDKLNTETIASPSQHYIQRILKSIELDSQKTLHLKDLQPSKKALVTERELQVIRLLAEGLSYIEIADRMYISINTLKTYIKSIYGKLDIHNKVEAINRAKELNIL